MRGSPAAGRPQWPIAALVTMSATVFLSVTSELLPTGLLPAMSRDLGVTEGRLGLLVTAFAVVVAVFATPLGVVFGRTPRRPLLVAALVGYAVCNAVTGLSGSYAVTLAARMLGGLTHGVFWGMLAGYAGRIVAPERVGRAVTLLSVGGSAAPLLGVPGGTALGVAFGWRPVFLGLAAVTLILAAVCLRLLPPVAGWSPVTRLRLLEVIRLPGLGLIVVVTAVTMLGHFSFTTYIAPYLLHAGLTEAAVGPALIGYGVVGMLGLTLAGLLVDRRPRFGMLAGSISLVAAFTLLAVVGTAPVAAVLGCAATGLAIGSLPVFLQTELLRAAPRAAEQASALNASAFNVGIGGGALLGGLVVDQWGPGALPFIAAALTGLGLLALTFHRAQPAVAAPLTAGR